MIFAAADEPQWYKVLTFVLSATTIGALVWGWKQLRSTKRQDAVARVEIRRDEAEIDAARDNVIIRHLRQLIRSQDERIKHLEAKDEQHDREIAECRSERAELRERVKWLMDHNTRSKSDELRFPQPPPMKDD